MTARDRQIALDCYDHRSLTTELLRRLHFSSLRVAHRREQLAWSRDSTLALAGSSKLPHLSAINEFFTRLAAERAEPIDARVGPEVDEDDLPGEARRRQRSELSQPVAPSKEGS